MDNTPDNLGCAPVTEDVSGAATVALVLLEESRNGGFFPLADAYRVKQVIDKLRDALAAAPSRPPVADNDQGGFLYDNRQQLALARHIRGLGSQTSNEHCIEVNPAYVARKLIEDGWRKTEGA